MDGWTRRANWVWPAGDRNQCGAEASLAVWRHLGPTLREKLIIFHMIEKHTWKRLIILKYITKYV